MTEPPSSIDLLYPGNRRSAGRCPAGMSLTLDIGGGSIVLRVQRVELLVEPMLGRDPRIDRTADRSDGWSLHGRASVLDRSSVSRRPKKRGPFHLVPVMAKATLERLS